jgi:hypothetical protein
MAEEHRAALRKLREQLRNRQYAYNESSELSAAIVGVINALLAGDDAPATKRSGE